MSLQERPNVDLSTKKFYRAKELAEYLGIGLSTVWKFVKEGRLKAYKIGGTVTVFNLEEVERDLLEEALCQ